MSELANASVRVRDDIFTMESNSFAAIAAPGGSLPGDVRVALADAARGRAADGPLEEFARHLYSSPATVAVEHVRKAADAAGDPQTVETIGIVARLSALDRVHQVLDVGLEPLPTPHPGPATGEIATDLKRRRGHLPMPPGPIPVTLDLVPSEAEAFRAMFGPLYMTEEEMADPNFGRDPGLNTPQLETVAARISIHNQCFYWVFAHARRLRWSGEILGYDIRIEGVADPNIDVGVPGGSALVALVDSFVTGDVSDRQQARNAVLETLGPESLVDAAAVFGNFEMMNRVAEGTGIPVPPQALEREAEMMEKLGLYDILKSQHT